MENLQIKVGVMETIILFIKTTTKGSKSLLQVLKHETNNHYMYTLFTRKMINKSTLFTK